MDEQKRLLEMVFGESSSESEGEIQQIGCSLNDGVCPTWEPIKEIKGLWLCREFLSPRQQSALLAAVQNEGWFGEAHNNQAMRFGDLPSWAIELSEAIREKVVFGDNGYEPTDLVSSYGGEDGCPRLSDIFWREPLFDQLIANTYQPGEGICAHIDLMRFEDGIAIISLESSCVMHFTRVGEVCGSGIGENNQPVTRIPVYLTPGSLVILSGDARYLWKHEINRKPGFQVWDGQELNQKRRTSITLRKLCQTE